MEAARRRWLTPVILVILETEIRKIKGLKPA
jgi:hypothetical protein